MLKPTSGILDGLVHFLEGGLILLLHPAQQRLVHRPLQVLEWKQEKALENQVNKSEKWIPGGNFWRT